MDVNLFLKAVREKQPLIHHLTNWVTIYDCAQVVKSFGASPVMAHAPEEVADMAGMASALVLNIGTLTSDFIDSMKSAALAANSRGIPVLLDVCGAGSTVFRDTKCLELLDSARINIIKGNSSEVARIAGLDVRTRGVDTTDVGEDLHLLAITLAAERKCTVAVTGKDDIVTDSKTSYIVHNGTEMMTRVVGTGCMAASVIGTFAGASPGEITAACAAGLSCYGIAAELAVKNSEGPGSFKQNLFDCIHHLTRNQVSSMQRVTE